MELLRVEFAAVGAAAARSVPDTGLLVSVTRDTSAPAAAEVVDDTPFSFEYTARHDGGPLPGASPSYNPYYDHLLAAIDVSGLGGRGKRHH